jgi:hypothetical protein
VLNFAKLTGSGAVMSVWPNMMHTCKVYNIIYKRMCCSECATLAKRVLCGYCEGS